MTKKSDEKPRGTILLIEDEAMLVQIIQKKLKMNGFEVVSATSGEQALDYLEDLTELPDAVWLDYYLGDMNGLDFLSKMKASQKWKDVPVIVVSNSASDEKVHSMLALGANKYVLKAEHRLDEIVDIFDQFVTDQSNKM